MQALFAVLALLAGAAAAFWIKSASHKAEKKLWEAHAYEQRAALEKIEADLAAARAAAAQANLDLAASAGFERLAEERKLLAEKLQGELSALRLLLDNKQDECAQLLRRDAELKTQLESEQKSAAEKLAFKEQAQQILANQFETLAAKILDEKSKHFSEGSQKELRPLIDPLREQLDAFRKKVEEAQTDSKTGVAKLETLVGSLGALNQQLAAEAHNLSTALRGSSKAQGDWGEFILRDLLEKAGLREGEQYSFQQVFSDALGEDGKKKILRTDVVLLLPGGRNLVIDSKVSLNAYTDFANADTDEARKSALKAHLTSVRNHLAILAKAGYQNLPGLESPDFVVMFVPVEPAFLAALQADANLWAEAYRQSVLLVGPTTLLYIVRIVDVLWRQEQQARNVREVMERGSALYEKFVGFAADLQAVGANLQKADQSYQGAMKKLAEGPGNLVRQVEMLKQLGLRASKHLPEALLDRAGLDNASLDEPAGLALAAQSGENNA